jgi:hypothetical protein
MAGQELCRLAVSHHSVKETLIKSFDELHHKGGQRQTNVKLLIPFVVSSSNHEGNQLIKSFLKIISHRQYGCGDDGTL